VWKEKGGISRILDLFQGKAKKNTKKIRLPDCTEKEGRPFFFGEWNPSEKAMLREEAEHESEKSLVIAGEKLRADRKEEYESGGRLYRKGEAE